MKRLQVDIHDAGDGNLSGTVEFTKDGQFVFEAVLLVLEQFSEFSGVPTHEIIADLYNYRRTKNETLSDISC